MKRQMEMAFMKEGGLKDDGTRQDPVSGNEVPSGSMASEVRDDIPAQLSEGEYVVPADVVRYLGVKHFEDLRNKAKSGLQKMEADGRIGGEPVPVGGPKANSSLQPPVPYAPPMAPQMAMGGDLTPEEMQEINSIMMASGGMVSGAAAGSFYSPLSGITVEQAITTPTRYTGAFSWEKPQPTAPVKTPVTETPATCAARGMVYNPETKMCEVPTDIEVEKDLDRDKGGPPEKTPDPIAWSRDITDPVSWAKENNTSPIPGLFGKLGTLGNVARIEAMAIIARENNDEKTAKQLEAIVEQTIEKNSWIELVPEDLRNGTQIAQSLRKDTKTTSYINNIYSRPAFEKRQETRRAEVLANKEAQAKKDKKAAAKALKSLQKSNTRGGRSNVTGVNIDRDPMGMATMSTTYGSGSGAETFSATADDEGASTPSQGLGGMYSDGYTADVNKGGLMRKKKK
jgi:hypothetical protein